MGEKAAAAEALPLVGHVFCSEEVHATAISKVVSAAQEAGLDPKGVRDIKPRNAFIRAMRELQRTGVIVKGTDGILSDKFQDDEDSVEFQFSKKYVEAAGVKYVRETVVRFDKTGCAIRCENSEYKKLAEELYVKVHGVYSVTDLNNFVARVIKAECHRVPLKDGVYFISFQHAGLLEKIQKFYAALGFTLHVFSVGHGGQQPKNIFKAVLKDLAVQMQSTTDEIGTLKAGGELTPRVAKNRLKDLRKQLDQYREIASALRVDLDTMLVQAGDAGVALAQVAQPIDSLIRLVQRGSIDQTLGELLVSAGEVSASAFTLGQEQRRVRPALPVELVQGELPLPVMALAK